VTDAQRGAAAEQSAQRALLSKPMKARKSGLEGSAAPLSGSASDGRLSATTGETEARSASISEAMAPTHSLRSAGDSALSTMWVLSDTLWAKLSGK
jgi:hypothetical protein